MVGLGTAVLAVVFIAAFLASLGSVTARQGPKFECENSRAGRHHIVDSSGYVCSRTDLDFLSGCCSDGQAHSCDTCHVEDQCCSSYEHCVSCCLRPEFNATALAKDQFRIHGHPNTGKWDNAFQYCMGKCRTHQLSTEHENSFIDDRHFCFSDSGRPKTAEKPQPVPAHVTVAQSEVGADCMAACAERGLACSEAHLPAVSQCDILRDHFPCEAGCHTVKGEMAAEAPAYVVYGTMKQLFPTLCFTLPDAALPSCVAAQAHLQRLCACVPLSDGEATAGTINSLDAAGQERAGEADEQSAIVQESEPS
eukprot:jgi/Ulvmu1/6051/UM027_0029.1